MWERERKASEGGRERKKNQGEELEARGGKRGRVESREIAFKL